MEKRKMDGKEGKEELLRKLVQGQSPWEVFHAWVDGPTLMNIKAALSRLSGAKEEHMKLGEEVAGR